MKNKIFNYKLYIDGVKQLKLIGTISTIILSVFAGLITIGQIIASTSDGYEYEELIVSLSDIAPVNQAIYLLIVPVMCLLLFNFLTKRNYCDFYHALPLKRQGLFLSFYASIMTWVVCMMIVSSLVSIIIAAIIPSMHLIVPSIFIYWLEILAASVLVSGGFMIAISLTGTTFTNIMVALLILFVPRLIIAVSALIIKEFFPYIEITSNGIILNYHNNLLISTFTSMIEETTYSSTWGPITYTLVLGIIYLTAGCYLFTRRKSEVAGNAAINHKLQLVYRLVISFLICLYPCYKIFFAIFGIDKINSNEKFSIFIIYVIAIIVYFLYELLTTKKLENLFNAIPGLGILAGLNIAFIICLSVGTIAIRHTLPNENNIKYFTMSNDTTYYQSSNNYFTKACSDIKITDKDAITLVADLLNETAEICQDSPKLYYYGAYTLLDIEINTITGTRKYHIPVSENEFNTLQAFLEETDDYKQLYTNLLPVSSSYLFVTMSTVGSNMFDYDPQLSQETYNKIYESARNELINMNYKDAYNYINNYSGYYIETLECTYISDNEQYNYNIKISPELPKTYLLYITELTKVNNYNFILDMLSDFHANSIINNNYNTDDLERFSEYLTIDHHLINNYLYAGIDYYGQLTDNEFIIYNTPTDDTLSLLSKLSEHLTIINENIDIDNTNIIHIYYRHNVEYNETAAITTNKDLSEYEYIQAYFIIDEEGMVIFEQLQDLYLNGTID